VEKRDSARDVSAPLSGIGLKTDTSATVTYVTRNPRGPRLADPGTLLATTHEVEGGLRVCLRLARTSDARRVDGFLSRLSTETLHGRFLGALPRVPQDLVGHFTFFDPRERLVVVATAMVGGREGIVGLADVSLPDSGVALLAMVIDEDRQDQGVGKLLTEVAATLAMRQGASRIRVELPLPNGAMVHLMERLGRTARTDEDGTTILVTTLPTSRRRAA
jgi:GNAT superfamily N-acetyltransferase